MFNNLLRREGLITTRKFSNPFPKFIIITREEFASKEVEEIHELYLEEENLAVFLNQPCKHIKDSWITLYGGQRVETKIE
jgi:hypothetical protein